jgi:hypothetical protein
LTHGTEAGFVSGSLHSRRRRRAISWLVLVCTLFSQAALAAVPCLSPDARATDAFAAMPEGCDDAPPSTLCLAHCVAADQTSGHPEVALALPAPATLAEAPTPVLAPSVPPAAFTHRALTCGPPPYLRLCSLLL